MVRCSRDKDTHADWDPAQRTALEVGAANGVARKDNSRLAFGNDPDADRHGIVTPSAGLMNPDHYLAAAVRYLDHASTAVPEGGVAGKTRVSSSSIGKVVQSLVRPAVGSSGGVQVVCAGSVRRRRRSRIAFRTCGTCSEREMAKN